MIATTKSASANVSPDLWDLYVASTEHAPSPMATVDGATHILRHVNPAFCRMMGKPAEELVGKPLGELLPPQDECVTLLDRVYRTGTPDALMHRRTRSNPHPFFWAYTLWPVMADKQPIGVVIQVTETATLHEQTVAMNEALMKGSVRQHELTKMAESAVAALNEEIRDRKLAEAALERAKAQLAEHAGQLEAMVLERTAQLTATNKQLEVLVYSIAHDLRAPLRSMEGFTTLLVEEAGAALSPTARDYAQRINKSARFMDALLGDLLNFSHLGQEKVELTPVDLNTVVAHVLSRLQKDIHEKKASVENSGPWPSVLAHAVTLSQVLFNLMSNALKFARPGEPPRVRLSAGEQAGFVRVSVEDDGIGIPPDHQKQIFRLFTRLNGEAYPGTGFGLAIVEKGIERMGGRVGVESTPGHGSCFWFELRKA